MVKLRTLGTIDLASDEGVRIDALLRRPKRLALLAYLVTAHPDTTYRREKLLAMFWPEIDEQRARGSLRQSIHVLRQHLGADCVTTIGDEQICLSPTVIGCDATAFDRAIREGQHAHALALYEGEFLPGLFLDGAGEFDEWLESTRSRLREQATAAAIHVAGRAASTGDHLGSLAAARRAVSIAPSDERASRLLISALDRTGDRGAAIATYAALAQRLHSDFEVLPSAETQAVIAEVRARDQVRLVADPMRPPTRQADLQLVPRPPSRRRVTRLTRAIAGGALFGTVLLLTGSGTHPTSRIEPPAVPPAARDAYARARFYLGKPSEENLHRSVLLFEKALDAEPLYAAAYAGLGDAYLRLGYGSYLAPSDAFPKALAAARRAIELDSLAPEAHATLAFARMYFDWDWAGADREFRLATTLAPDYALAHDWYAYLLTATGHDVEARQQVDLAQRLDPLSVAIAVDAGFVAFYAGDLTEARRRLMSALLMAPEVPGAHLWLGRLEQREGHLERARAEYEASGELKAWVPTISGAAYVEAVRGNTSAARMALVRLDSMQRTRYVTPYAVALVHVALGETDEAFTWLDRAVADRAHWLVWLNRDPRWDPIRRDPRFAALVQRVGVPR